MNIIRPVQNAARNIGRQVVQGGKKGIEVANFIVTNTEAFYKTTKVAVSTFGIMGIALTSFAPGAASAVSLLNNVSKAPKATQSVMGATNVFSRIYEWTDPNKRTEITTTMQKTAKMALLTLGQGLESIAFLGSAASLNLGALATNVIGNLPLIHLVKNVAITLSSGFAIWDSVNRLQATKADHEKAERKLATWKAMNNNVEVVNHYTAKRQSALGNQIESPAKWAEREQNIDRVQSYKVSKYETMLANSEKTEKKSWLAIAADIAKIAIIVIGTVAAALMLSATAFVLCTAAVGLLAASLGLAKTLHSQFGPKLEPLPTFPPEANAA